MPHPSASPALRNPALQEAYDAAYTNADQQWRAIGAKYKAQNILAVCQGHSFHTVLECGAGDGNILRALAAANFGETRYAIDISRSGVMLMQQQLGAQLNGIARFDGYHLPFANDAVDLIILSHVLEHVEHPRWLLRELWRVAPFVVVEIPLDYWVGIDAQLANYLAYGHINVFTPSTLRFLLKAEGLTPIAERHSIIAQELLEYQYQMQHGQPMPGLRRAMLRGRRALGTIRRALLPQALRSEFMYSAYTVLCQRTPPVPVGV